MLVTIAQLFMATGNPLVIQGNPQASLGTKPGTEIAFDPETSLIFACVGSEVHVVPSANVRQMRVATEDIAALREWLKSRGAKKKAAA